MDDKQQHQSDDEGIDMNLTCSAADQEVLLAAWEFICDFAVEPPTAPGSFLRRVIMGTQTKDEPWDIDEAKSALLELYKFMFLKAKYTFEKKDADRLIPPPKVDLFWREMILYTAKYAELCAGIKKTLGLTEDKEIFHRQHPLLLKQEDRDAQYKETYQEYTSVFGKPKDDLWPEDLTGDHDYRKFYGKNVYCTKKRQKEGPLVTPEDDIKIDDLRLTLTEEGKTAVSPFEGVTRTPQEVVDLLNTIEFEPGLVELFQRETGLPVEYVQRLVKEYKKYIFLSVFSKDNNSPSSDMDQMWHFHIASTRNYARETTRALGRFLQHFPGNGMPGEIETYEPHYNRTLDNLTRFFGEPDTEVWPAWDQTMQKGVGPYVRKFAWRPRDPPIDC